MICADCGLGIKEIKNIKFYWYYKGEDTSAIITVCESCYDKYVDKNDLYEFITGRIMTLTGDKVEIEPQEIYIC